MGAWVHRDGSGTWWYARDTWTHVEGPFPRDIERRVLKAVGLPATAPGTARPARCVDGVWTCVHRGREWYWLGEQWRTAAAVPDYLLGCGTGPVPGGVDGLRAAAARFLEARAPSPASRGGLGSCTPGLLRAAEAWDAVVGSLAWNDRASRGTTGPHPLLPSRGAPNVTPVEPSALGVHRARLQRASSLAHGLHAASERGHAATVGRLLAGVHELLVLIRSRWIDDCIGDLGALDDYLRSPLDTALVEALAALAGAAFGQSWPVDVTEPLGAVVPTLRAVPPGPDPCGIDYLARFEGHPAWRWLTSGVAWIQGAS